MVLIVQMLDGPNDNTRTEEELLLRAPNLHVIPGEIRPIGILPVPGHERQEDLLSLIISSGND